MDGEDPQERLWVQTPLIYSNHISDLLGCSAYLKLENLQPSQSFKYRGVSLLVQLCKAKYGPSLHIFAASSGNAGLAAAIAARRLGVRCTIYLLSATRQAIQVRLRHEGAHVVAVGQIYAESVTAMREAAKLDPNAVIVPSYEHPVLWEGHSSMVKEMKIQLGEKPDAILGSVGGGGLIGGVLLGCKAVGWDDVPVIALETHGSNCFYQANALNTQGFTSKSCTFPPEIPNDQSYTVEINSEHTVAIPHLRALHSRAVSLGATYAAPEVVRMALDHPAGVKCVCIADELAMYSAQLFTDDHKMLVELACSTTISAAYNHEFFWRILDPESALSPEEKRKKTVVFVVCGGINISYSEVASYTDILEEAAAREHSWRIVCNGAEFHVSK
ncbi:tryptophan synthase beta subunit-like PLP-dependent enzyme [Pisolithus marmoratus]|nr:tryptophan synthase beta subunit-like PLP-dependent enzyme [Pisolithus marmoratus]